MVRDYPRTEQSSSKTPWKCPPIGEDEEENPWKVPSLMSHTILNHEIFSQLALSFESSSAVPAVAQEALAAALRYRTDAQFRAVFQNAVMQSDGLKDSIAERDDETECDLDDESDDGQSVKLEGDDEEAEMRTAQPQQLDTVQVSDAEAIDKACLDRFELMTQPQCKKLCKEWIKIIQPKKQARNPYNGGKEARAHGWDKADEAASRLKQPDWWPPGVIHKEPDHLRKQPRLKLLMHIMSMLIGPQRYHDCIRTTVASDPHITVEQLRVGTERAASTFIDGHAQVYLDDIYNLKTQQVSYLNDEIDGTKIVTIRSFHLSTRVRNRLGKRTRNAAAGPSLKTVRGKTRRKYIKIRIRAASASTRRAQKARATSISTNGSNRSRESTQIPVTPYLHSKQQDSLGGMRQHLERIQFMQVQPDNQMEGHQSQSSQAGFQQMLDNTNPGTLTKREHRFNGDLEGSAPQQHTIDSFMCVDTAGTEPTTSDNLDFQRYLNNMQLKSHMPAQQVTYDPFFYQSQQDFDTGMASNSSTLTYQTDYAGATTPGLLHTYNSPHGSTAVSYPEVTNYHQHSFASYPNFPYPAAIPSVATSSFIQQRRSRANLSHYPTQPSIPMDQGTATSSFSSDAMK
ncbi:hypothetical protein MMC25_000638 [Agyrium rufum]|nr:hypothetical protein [Agyrium rufum]